MRAERDRQTSLAPCEAVEQISVHQRVRGIAPERAAGVILFGELATPERFARLGIEAGEHPFGAERVEAAVINRCGAAGAARIREPVRLVVRIFPELFAGCCVEAEDPFLALERHAFSRTVADFPGAGLIIHHKDFAAGHRRSAIAEPDRCPPFHIQALFWKTFHNPIFVPDTGAIGTHPLWPIVGKRGPLQDAQQKTDGHSLKQSHINSSNTTGQWMGE